MKQALVYFLVFTSIFTENSGFASSNTNNVQLGRYVTVVDKPRYSQVNLLSQIIQVRFPQNVQTIGDAMNYMLRLSGYSLTPVNRMNKSLKITLSKPLPAIDRNFGPMPLKDALSTLAGPAFYLVQDPLNRMVDFKVKPEFAKLYVNNG